MKKTAAGIMAVALCLFVCAPGGASRAESGTRNFVLIFEILDYTRAIGDAVSFFINRVLGPEDQLIIYTPARVYGFSPATLAKPKRDLVRSVQDHLRGDTAYCSAHYKTLMNDMNIQVRDVEGYEDMNALRRALTLYRQSLANLRSLRKVDEALLSETVAMFKAQPGTHHIVMTYQAEFRPIPDRETLNRLRAMPVISFEANELFAETDKSPPLDAGLFIDMFKDVDVAFHFFYVKPKDAPSTRNMKEHSVDMYNAFSRIAKATGGIVETSAQPEAAFRALLRALGATAE